MDNTSQGIAQLVEWMQALQPELMVVEATDGYQRRVVEALFHAGLSLAVVNPTRVRQFAKACGLLDKTDSLDAHVLAEFGQRVQSRRYAGKSQAEKQLSALLVRRRQVEETRLLQAQRRANRCAQCALDVHPGGYALPSVDPSPIPTLAETWQGKEDSAHCLNENIPLYNLKNSNCLDIQTVAVRIVRRSHRLPTLPTEQALLAKI